MPRKITIESMELGDRRRKTTTSEVSDEDEDFFRGVREVLAELSDTEDVTLLTLKGHLIIEQILIQMVECAATNATPLKKLNRLQFSTRVILAESLSAPSEQRPQGIWPLVRKVGNIRNDIAHKLKPKKLDEDLQSFIDLYIHFFGARVLPPVHPDNREIVTKDNYIIPSGVRNGSIAQKYRNALAGTAQGLAGMLAVIRDDAKLAREAVRKHRGTSRKVTKRKDVL